jgi:dTDP-4-dehydrorhamnose reductase
VESILLIGASGQLGSDLGRTLPTVLPGAAIIALKRADLDVTDPAAVERVLEAQAPAWVVNTAAFHRVDDIETVDAASQLAFAVNEAAAGRLARVCARGGTRLLHLSTDYVFSGGQDGGQPGPYAEDATPAPVCNYGVSKLAGERLVRQASPGHVIVRSSGLYGVAGSAGKGGNFVEMMLRLAKEGKPIQVVNDQTLTPTYTADLAEAIARLIAVNPPGGVYHLTNAGQCSWFDFASRIFDDCGLTPHLTAVTTEQFGAPAPRPRPNSALRNTRAAALGVPPLRPWPEALRAYLRAKGHLAA